jgi:hypothetical protein
MADTYIFLPGVSGPTKIKAVDQLDGTYALKITTTAGAGTSVFLPGATGPIKVQVVSQGDGTYALLASGS